MEWGDIIILLSAVPLFVLFVLSVSGKNSLLNRKTRLTFASIHIVLVVGALALLYYYIFTNQFQYFYVYSHSARDLPLAFKISCLWEGQEGSFLLWIFWNAIIVLVLAGSKKELLSKALIFFIPVQLFLSSMLLGWEFASFNFNVGSSPFALISERINSEIFTVKPDFVFSDGTGMNALLQNYWMVIHPPVIFLGFAISAVPFCLCLAGLLRKSTIGEWSEFATPWVILSIITIGIGMIMGAYWAYETLNFGGFWNWDPVENAIYVPWIVQIVVLHLLILYKKKQVALKMLTGLTLVSFLLVVYSTFLTRSGILGNTSVHAFTDLGLSGQLLLFLILFVSISVLVYVRALKFFPKTKEDKFNLKSYDFWMVLGVLVLSLAAFQVWLSTSFPVFNAVGNMLGFDPNLAPPVNQVAFYNDFQIWFALAVLVCISLAQVFYWRKALSGSWLDILFVPVIITTIISIVVFLYFGSDSYRQLITILVVTACAVFNLYLVIAKYDFFSKASGSISHVGFGVMILGILISQGYQKVITDQEQFKGVLNSAGNILLVKNKEVKVGDFDISLKNSYYETKSGELVNKKDFIPDRNPKLMIVNEPQQIEGEYYEKGDKIKINRENVFHRVRFSANHDSFEITPRVQFNRQMGVIPSPDIVHRIGSDIYTHVSNFPDDNKNSDWGKANKLSMKIGEKWVFEKGLLELMSVVKLPMSTDSTLALKAALKYTTPSQVHLLKPVLLKGQTTRVIQDKIAHNDLKIVFDASSNDGNYGFSYLPAPMEWITIKSTQFPLIFLVWLGGILMIFGLCCSLFFKFGWEPKLEKNGFQFTGFPALDFKKIFIQYVKNKND